MNTQASDPATRPTSTGAGVEPAHGHFVELTPTTLQVARVDSGAVTLSRNAALDNKAILDLLLNETAADWQENGWTASVATYLPSVSWHMVELERIRSLGTGATVGAVAESLEHGISGDTIVAACGANSGAPVEAGSENKWLFAVAPAEGLAKLLAHTERCKIRPAATSPGVLDHVGAISRLLRVSGRGSVALWEPGVDRSTVFFVTAKGVEAVVPCTLKLTDVWETIRSELNLKYQLAAARLFYGDLFDFTDAAPRITAALAPALASALDALPDNGEKPALAVAGFTPTQGWLVHNLASALGTIAWGPDAETALGQFGVQPGGELTAANFTPATFGLLHRASIGANGTAWQAAWHPTSNANFAIALPAAPKPAAKPVAPVAKAPAPAPKPAPVIVPEPEPVVEEPVAEETPTVEAVAEVEVTPEPVVEAPAPVIEKPKPAPAPVAKPVAPAPVAKAPIPAPKPAPAPAPVAKAPTPAPAPAAKPAPAPVAKAPEVKPAPAPVAKPVTPAPQAKLTTPAPAAKVQPAPTPAPAAKAPTPAPAAKPAPAPAPAKAPEAKPAPAPAAKVEAKPAPVAKAPEVKPAPTPAPAPKAQETKPAPAPAAVAAAPAAPAKKKSMGAIYGAIAAVVVLSIGGYFYMDSQAKAKAEAAAKEKANQEQLARIQEEKRVAEDRAKQLEAMAKAENERIARETEARRQADIARANQVADAQRMQREAEERLARAPGVIMINTEPAGAEVSVDGGTPQLSPAVITNVNPGLRKVVIKLPGYDAVEQLTDVRGAQTTDLGVVRLQKEYGEVMIRSNPADSEFAIYSAESPDGAPIRQGKAPARIDRLTPGAYVVKLSKSGLIPTTEHFTVKAHETVEVTSVFMVGGVVISSQPAGATITRNGHNLGVTPLTLKDVTPGDFGIELTLPQHETVRLGGKITDKETLRLHGEMLHVDRVAKPSEVKSPPQVAATTSPVIPDALLQQGGEVIISLVVSKDGTVRDIRVERTTNPALVDPCVKALEKWTFTPGKGMAGQSLNLRLSIPFRFSPPKKAPASS